MEPVVIRGKQYRYNLLALLADGRAARVYRAARSDGAEVALRLFAPRLRDGWTHDELLAHFRASADALRSVDHPCIPKVHEIIEKPLCVVMDLVPGADLHRTLQRRSFSISETVNVIAQAADLVGWLHQQGRSMGACAATRTVYDGCNANLMLTPAGVVHLADMGDSHHNTALFFREQIELAALMLGMVTRNVKAFPGQALAAAPLPGPHRAILATALSAGYPTLAEFAAALRLAEQGETDLWRLCHYER